MWAPPRVTEVLMLWVLGNRTRPLVERSLALCTSIFFTHNLVLIFMYALGTIVIFFSGVGKLKVSVRVQSK